MSNTEKQETSMAKVAPMTPLSEEVLAVVAGGSNAELDALFRTRAEADGRRVYVGINKDTLRRLPEVLAGYAWQKSNSICPRCTIESSLYCRDSVQNDYSNTVYYRDCKCYLCHAEFSTVGAFYSEIMVIWDYWASY